MLSDADLDLLFRNARTHSDWLDRPVGDEMLRRIYAVARTGPTSANSSPARFYFLRGAAAKQRLRPFLSEGNTHKTMTAPVTAIIGYDTRFYERLGQLFPHNLEARSWFEGNEKLIETTAFRNGTLQGAYFIVAARAAGLDCGAMSGFDNAGVDGEFFAGTGIKSNFLLNLGYGDHDKLPPRNPRLSFDEACTLI